MYSQKFSRRQETRRKEALNSREKMRTQQRQQEFQKSRKILAESTNDVKPKDTADTKVNPPADKQNPSKYVISTKNEQLSSKQLAYLQRFREWKHSKKEDKTHGRNKENDVPKKPFIPAGISTLPYIGNGGQLPRKGSASSESKPSVSSKSVTSKVFHID